MISVVNPPLRMYGNNMSELPGTIASLLGDVALITESPSSLYVARKPITLTGEVAVKRSAPWNAAGMPGKWSLTDLVTCPPGARLRDVKKPVGAPSILMSSIFTVTGDCAALAIDSVV